MNRLSLLVGGITVCLLTPYGAAIPEPVRISLIQDQRAGAPARYGAAKLKAALTARGVSYDEPANFESAHGQLLIVTSLPDGPAKLLGVAVPSGPNPC